MVRRILKSVQKYIQKSILQTIEVQINSIIIIIKFEQLKRKK